jgi:hypothetical protein
VLAGCYHGEVAAQDTGLGPPQHPVPSLWLLSRDSADVPAL